MSWKHSAVVPKTPLQVAQRAHHNSIKRKSDISLDKTLLARLYTRMLLIRVFEDEVATRARKGEGLAIHPYSGQEAVAVGVCSLLSNNDKVVSNHRPFGHFIAKGGGVNKLMAELYGKRTGVTKGLGGEMNLSEPSIGFMLSSMLVGANISISTGVSLAQKLSRDPGITVCFFGEGASTNGAFHEALTMAALLKLPTLYVCENNGYSTNSPAREFMPTPRVEHRARGYGFPTTVIDGSDVISVVRAASEAIEHVRSGGGPYFIEAIVGRLGPHKQELVDTRDEQEKFDAVFRDPIIRLRTFMRQEGLMSGAEEARIVNGIRREVASAVKFAKNSKKLSFKEMTRLVYADKIPRAPIGDWTQCT